MYSVYMCLLFFHYVFLCSSLLLLLFSPSFTLKQFVNGFSLQYVHRILRNCILKLQKNALNNKVNTLLDLIQLLQQLRKVFWCP